MWLLTSAVIVEGYRFCRVDYGSEFSSFSHYSVDALIALLGTIDISRRRKAVLTTKLLLDVTIPEPRDTHDCPVEVREHPTQEMCPQALAGCEMISPKLPGSFHIQLNIPKGPKLLSLDVFRTIGKLLPTLKPPFALPVSWVLPLAFLRWCRRSKADGRM